MIILSSIKYSFLVAFCAATTLFLGAAYSIWMLKRVIFGEITNSKIQKIQDIDNREFFLLSLFAIAIIFIGLYPKLLIEVIHSSTDIFLKSALSSKI